MGQTPPFFRRLDLIVVGLLLATALILGWLTAAENGQTAVVRVNGTVTHTLSLAKDGEFPLQHNGYHLTVTVQNGRVSVTQSNCPDRVCRNTAAIHKAGQTIVCLPAACSVTVMGTASADAITY